MASGLPPNASSSKSVTIPISVNSTVAPQAGQSSGAEGHAQRRSGGTGSHGAGSLARSSNPTPRNKQASRNQHKQSRRPRLADEDAMAESAAITSARNRKGQTSITHLMNFSLPPRPSQFPQRQHGGRNARRNPTWGLGSGYHSVDKARYVHANYRFIVDPRRDYHAQSVDADVYLDWSNIMQILASPQSQASACPICLGDPVAPRMAKCGHIFCLHCLIRYMHSSEDHDHYPEKRARWKKCPICWDSVYLSETRPVRWYMGQEGPTPHENEDIVLRLVMRPAGSTLALPRDGQPPSKDEDIPWHFAANVMDYARVMKGSEDYMISQFDLEIEQLEEVERHDEVMFGEDAEWTGRAIRAVNDAKEKIKGLGNPPPSATTLEETRSDKNATEPTESLNLHPDAPEMYSLQHDARSGRSVSNLPPVQENEATTADQASRTSLTSPSDTSGWPNSTTSALSSSLAQFRAQQNTSSQTPTNYYFYQALLHYYLSPLDIRILKAAFGDFSAFPSTILPQVERISSSQVVDDDLRKRAKYLAHLPHGCEVAFLECDWTDIVPKNVLEKFKPDIERRRKRHSDKDAREEKERVRAEKEEDDKRYAAARRKRPSSPIEALQPDGFQPLTPTPAAVGEGIGSLESGEGPGSPIWGSRAQNGSSFAALSSPSTSPNATRTVWGTTAITPASPTLQPAPKDTGPVDDGWLQGWERDLLQEEDLVAKVQAASLTGEPSTASQQTVGKKKKGKKITLMSTTSSRRGA